MEHALNTLRRGSCPGVYTPMMASDGLIVRVRAGVRPLTGATLQALAGLARAHGNGLIEVTRRANLQLRGVRADALTDLQHELVALGLADASPERERKLAVVSVDPLLALDPAHAELASCAQQLAAGLGEITFPRAISAKFAIAIDGPRGGLRGAAADVRIELSGRGAGLWLAGQWLGRCELGATQQVLAALLEVLVACGASRMDDAAQAASMQSLRRHTSLWLTELPAPAHAARDGAPTIGFRAEPRPWLGLAIPFGSAEASIWDGVADLSRRFGDGLVRATPTRALILTGVDPAAEAEVARVARACGLIIDARDPRLRAVACTGAPGCPSALGETRALAASLATTLLPQLGNDATLHVSGCIKSCARGAAASVTLVHARGGLQLGFDSDVAHTACAPAMPRAIALARLAALTAGDKVPDPMTRTYDYERDAAEIYRRSFAIIRAEAELGRFSSLEERVAVRLIHTSGMVELARDIVFSGDFALAATRAIRAGAVILCDTKMVVSGVTRARLPADNEVLSFVDHPETAALAARLGTTRTAAALHFWADKVDGAVVAIGNAPTALFRLLELLDETKARPAAVIGLPVGFVGAAESKEALIADGRVPAMIVRGRKGGSAMTATAINALASEKE